MLNNINTIEIDFDELNKKGELVMQLYVFNYTGYDKNTNLMT